MTKPDDGGRSQVAVVEETPAPATADLAFVQMVERAAANPAVDVDKLERLLAMKERIDARVAKTAYTVAMSKMQPDLPTISADSKIVHNNKVISQYAKWEDINDIIKPILADNGFALDFSAAQSDKGIAVTAHLEHSGGHSKEATVPLPIDTSGAKNPVQGVGSTITYGKRYAAGLVLNLTSRAPGDADDDGKAAGGIETLSEDQVAALRQLIIDVDADLPKLLAHLKIEKLEDIYANQFESVKRIIERKRTKGAANV